MLLNDLMPASFRGVRFLVPSDTVEEGRNAVHHNYPDASFRYVEDNGRLTADFKLKALLTGPNLPARYKALHRALTRPGPGLLRHPWYGPQHVMVDGKFRVSRDDRDAGVLELEIPFAVTGPPSMPGVVTGVPAFVTSQATDLLTTLHTAFLERYTAPFTAPSAQAVSAVIEDVGATIDDQFSAVSTSGADLAAGAMRATMSPVALADAVVRCARETVFESDVDAATIVAGYDRVAEVAGLICDDAARMDASTGDRISRRLALDAVGEFVEAVALSCICEGIAGRAYATADEAEADEVRLGRLLEATAQRDWSSTVNSAIEAMFIATASVLAAVAVRRPRLIDIDTSPLPLSVLCYDLYESDANLQTLVAMNFDQPPVLATGSVTVLMEQTANGR